MTSEPDLFAEFESIGEILGFVLHSEGPQALQQLLTIAALDADTLYQAADGLAAAGMMDGAELVAKAADSAADQIPAEIASILASPNPANQRALLATMHRNNRLKMDDLMTAGVDPRDPHLREKVIKCGR
jgi:hypothetical protein